MLRAVLLDRDDTICSVDPAVYREAADWFAAEYGVNSGEVMRALQGHWREEFRDWQHLRTPEQESEFWQRYAAGFAQRLNLPPAAGAAMLARYPYYVYLKPVPGLRELLLDLRGRGLKVGILSNTLPDLVPSLVHLGIADLVDAPLSSCALGLHKPDPQVFSLAAQALGLPPAEVLFIDDRPENVEGARKVGMPARLINLHAEAPDALRLPHDLLGDL